MPSAVYAQLLKPLCLAEPRPQGAVYDNAENALAGSQSGAAHTWRRTYTRRMRGLLLGLALSAIVAGAEDRLAAAAQQKLDRIGDEVAKPGSTVTFSPAEVNAWVRDQIPENFPNGGVRATRIEFGEGTVESFALVDFRKVAEADGEQVNPVLGRLIEGERPLKVSLRVVSSGGRATFYLTSLELSGVTITGSLLDLLVQTFFLTAHPDAKINEPLELPYHLERIAVSPKGVRVVIAK